uniref:Uncharacterized protein n=1 Tax=Tanacetum cinerariifolium TaxID=118510 RepID=A0A6L2LXD2_TANCI|nr:hypothetical protein [Tanacetum cinerariifolium]GEU66426.1 hypothetical protein [Tanacetum cinerariifolium]
MGCDDCCNLSEMIWVIKDLTVTWRDRNTDDDDNFLFTMLGSPRFVPWLGSHTESVIAAMTDDWYRYNISSEIGASHPFNKAGGWYPPNSATNASEERQVKPIKEEEKKAAKVAAVTETKIMKRRSCMATTKEWFAEPCEMCRGNKEREEKAERGWTVVTAKRAHVKEGSTAWYILNGHSVVVILDTKTT